MEKWRNLGLILLLCFIIIVVFYKCRNTTNVKPTEIDSIKTVNDTLKLKIDSINKNIIDLNFKYEEDKSIIINQPLDSDILFFSRYLSEKTE